MTSTHWVFKTGFLLNLMTDWGERTVAVSEDIKKYLIDNYNYPEDKISVTINGIDTEKFRFDPVFRREKRKELRMEDDYVICHVGRFHDQKNHTFIVDVFRELCQLQPRCKLMLIGIGPLQEQIKEKVAGLGLSDKVMFLGQITDVHRMLSAADAFLFPSLYEGLPLTLVEAQASGLPVICSDAITDECHLTQEYEVLSLDTPPQEWAKAVLKAREFRIPREERHLLLKEKGYDSGDVAAGLAAFYIEKDAQTRS